jgi:O-acetyl-ADP-ribose deacetylase (regulator of RNase III)
MEIGENQVYPSQVVDGHVSELGGYSLLQACQALPVQNPRTGHRCLVGGAVVTPASEGLAHNFDWILHTVAPFYADTDWAERLQECYLSIIALARAHDLSSLACPLLGAGARGAPSSEAAAVAAAALSAAQLPKEEDLPQLLFKFGVVDDGVFRVVHEAFDACADGQWLEEREK